MKPLSEQKMKASEKWAYLKEFIADDSELIEEPLSAAKELLDEVSDLESSLAEARRENERYKKALEEIRGYNISPWIVKDTAHQALFPRDNKEYQT